MFDVIDKLIPIFIGNGVTWFIRIFNQLFIMLLLVPSFDDFFLYHKV